MLATRTEPNVSDIISLTSTLDGFEDINDAELDAVIWNRKIPNFIASALDTIPEHETEDTVFNSDFRAVGIRASKHFEGLGWPNIIARDWLVKDIQALADSTHQSLGWKEVTTRLEVVRDDACRKFHRDNMKARLICTYVGPATEYGLKGKQETPTEIYSVATGCPILLKGKQWPNPGQETLLHRSPPIESKALSRFLVVINEAPTEC